MSDGLYRRAHDGTVNSELTFAIKQAQLGALLSGGQGRLLAEEIARLSGRLDMTVSGAAGALERLREQHDALRASYAALTGHMNQVHDTLGGTDTDLTLEAAVYVMARLARAERAEAVLAKLREPSDALVLKFRSFTRPVISTYDLVRAVVKAAEAEVGHEPLPKDA